VDGRPVDESTKSDNYEVAKRHLAKMNGRKVRGELGGIRGKMTVNRVIDHYLELCKYKVGEATRKIYSYTYDAHLRRYFGAMRADRLSTETLLHYRKQRTSEGAVFSTVNRELVILRAALRAAAHASPPMIQVSTIPRFVIENEKSRARSGFVTDDLFEQVLAELPRELHPLAVCAYNSAVRKGELLKIRWPQVDFEAKLIRLRSGETKGKDPRTIPFIGAMEEHLLRAKAERDEFWPKCAFVFFRLGEQIRSFKGSWEAAVKRAGVPGLRFHDFRRSGIRNLVRAKVPESVAMKISGHKTRAIFDRYDITSEGDLLDAAEKLAAFRASKKGMDSDLDSDKNRDSAPKTPMATGGSDGH
jgi:integrase